MVLRIKPFEILLLILISFFISCGEEPQEKVEDKIPDAAIVLGNNVTLRTDPLPTAAEVESLQQGTQIKILKRSSRRVKISGFNEYWYFVKLDTEIEGWVYGAKLSVGAGADLIKSAEAKIAGKLQKQIVGKWWEVRQDGSTGYRKIYLWPDGKFKHSYGGGSMAEGTYELLTEERVILLDKKTAAGKRLTIRQVGRDLRLVGELKGTIVNFRLGDRDPEGKEVGLEEKL